MPKYTKLLLSDKKGIKARLMRHTFINPTTNCREFLGFTQSGYGQININGTPYRANRLSLYIYKNFDIDSKLQVLHKLECKKRNCWNPEHLYVGTNCQNAGDTVLAGSNFNKNKTHCPKGHEYTPENTYINPNKLAINRDCIICRNERVRNFRSKQ